jgi:drug/metabolite transporter (DMT)-like permease
LSGELVALLSALLWAMASVLMALVGRGLHPIPLNLIRCLVSTTFFWCLLPFFGGIAAVAAIEPGTWLWLALSVLLLLIVGDLLYLRSMDMAGVSWAMPVASINPLWAVLFAAMFVDEPLTGRLVAGAMLVVAGVTLVSQSTVHTETLDRRRQQVGLLLALLASLSWGIGQVVLKVATADLHSVVANSVRQPMGAVAMLGLNLVRGQWGDLRQMPRRSWEIILFASLVGTGVGSLLFVQAIQMVGAGRTAVLTSTSPLLAIPFAMLWLQERPNRRTVLGTVLAVGGIVLVV